jgi:hypothetical protein
MLPKVAAGAQREELPPCVEEGRSLAFKLRTTPSPWPLTVEKETLIIIMIIIIIIIIIIIRYVTCLCRYNGIVSDIQESYWYSLTRHFGPF